MERIVSSSTVRLTGLLLLAMAVLLGPQHARASAGNSGDCEVYPFAACEKCYDVLQYDGTVCDVLTCVAGPTIFSNCR